MKNEVFIFPKKSVSDYVILTPMLTDPLKNMTVCLRTYTDLRPGQQALFTIGITNPTSRHTFSIFESVSNYFLTYINNSGVHFQRDPDVREWRHICVSWDSTTGLFQLWVNDKKYPRTMLQRGYSIDLKEVIVLGQMQLNKGKEWDSTASFQGEICDVNMWDKVLSTEEVGAAMLYGGNGNIISWESLHYQIKGDVLIQKRFI
ncbi:hypothetical protein GDO86_016487 [Hymenochirus boettgeri]|uniref:Pentraxin family member n=1 Tax=Hymenochirus boettgeri TaxID=247094 RepID=A0A8T2K1E3_9PIPI|nr:hypothetical protein GDO86_016486 [Hymenochirus boettgeri]KAG8449833.1 hypothetical protein GDO86_016487 [Hymenochirus boettgeri]